MEFTDTANSVTNTDYKNEHFLGYQKKKQTQSSHILVIRTMHGYMNCTVKDNFFFIFLTYNVVFLKNLISYKD